MKIAVIGTGMVGTALAGRLSGLGHEVAVGTRDVRATLARTDPDGFGGPAFAVWHRDHPDVALLPFADAGAHGELVVNVTGGQHSLDALRAVGADNLAGKVLLDVALPLDLSRGMPPTLTVSGDDSLGEQIQREFPSARVVKSLNTVFKDVMVDPGSVPGRHNVFVAGDDPSAKAQVSALLVAFGWPADDVIDLGGITSARASEMYMQLYFQLAHQLGTFAFNIALQR